MKIMGILNVTPDSFSDGGRWIDPTAAIAQADSLWADGADIIDVGGESTNPRAERTSPEEEWQRISPVLPALLERGMVVSVDTINSATARKALALGVQIINDVSGGSHDPEMSPTVADSNAQYVVQHWRGFPTDPQLNASYTSVRKEAWEETQAQVELALQKGVRSDQVIVDPGLGFAKLGEDNWQLLQDLESWVRSGYPVLVGASRKRFLRERYGDRVDEATLMVTKRCLEAGVWAVRVHDARANLEEIGRISTAQRNVRTG